MILKGRGLPGLRAVIALAVLGGLLPVSFPADAQVGISGSRWWDEVDGVGELVDAGKWRRAARQAERLRDEVMSSSWREPDLAEVLAELAFQLAVARTNLGDEEAALWEWYTALNLERMRGRREIAERDLSPYARAAELLADRPLRAPEEYPPGYEPVDVQPLRSFEPPVSPPGFEVETLVNTAGTLESVDPVRVEVLVDTDGSLRHPVLFSTWSHPVVVQWTLDNVRRSSPYRPAKLDGEVVAVLQPIELSVGEQLHGEGGIVIRGRPPEPPPD